MKTVICLVSNTVKTCGSRFCCSHVSPERTDRRTVGHLAQILQDVGSDLACSLVDDTGRRFACVLSIESFANTTLCSFSTCGADRRTRWIFFPPRCPATQHIDLVTGRWRSHRLFPLDCYSVRPCLPGLRVTLAAGHIETFKQILVVSAMTPCHGHLPTFQKEHPTLS